MPYIKPERRPEVLSYSDNRTGIEVKVRDLMGPGELNFALTSIILDYIEGLKPMSYSKINEVIGVLECVKLEFYRRAAAPYEDIKIKENGDVY